ncbi:MOB-like protein phocein [Clavelina lepadiformis]|uniref:MOB-like protein phocein n=1 Tax=Clavelina lepadiformis TaxID=159417 RepID=A0ABP0F4H9_CLALP
MVSSSTVMNPQYGVCRNPPGTKIEDFYKWAEHKFDDMDSTLAVQQYIQQTIRQDYTNTEKILSIPPGQDEGVWKYEHLRQFCLELNGLAVRLQAECTPDTCSQMTATEQWIFLCAAHKTPKECPAIDYTRHTLDGAACLLNNNKYFPSRVSIKESSVAKLGSVCRRVYRIFSHAYYHHRQIFDEAENETCLCKRFTLFVIKYNLMSQDNLIVPILDDSSSGNTSNNNSVEIVPSVNYSIAKKPTSKPVSTGIASFLDLPEGVGPDDEDNDEEIVGFEIPPGLDAAEDDDIDDDGADLVDDFSYSTNPNFATLKPSKENLQNESLQSMEADTSGATSHEDEKSTEVEDPKTLDETVIFVELMQSKSVDENETNSSSEMIDEQTVYKEEEI